MTIGYRQTASLACAALLIAAAASAQTERRTLSGRDVRITDLVGTVTIEPGSVSDVTVEVTRRGHDANRLSINVGTDDGVPSLRIVFPDDDIVYPEMSQRGNSEFRIDADGNWGGDWRNSWRGRRIRVSSDGRGTEAWADLKVIVPSGHRVDVKVGVGTVNSAGVNADLGIDVAAAHVVVNGHTGTLRLDTGSGGADVRDVKGDELRAEVGSGHVSVTGAAMQRMSLESGSGGVDADRISAPDLSVDVGSGGVRIEHATSDHVKLETGSGGVDFELTNSPRSLDVDAGSGTVTLRLPASLDAELDIETGSGGIDSDFPIQMNRYERRHVRGTVGKGTGRIHVETGSGGVRLRKA